MFSCLHYIIIMKDAPFVRRRTSKMDWGSCLGVPQRIGRMFIAEPHYNQSMFSFQPAMGVSMIGKQRRNPGGVLSPREVFFPSPPHSPSLTLSPSYSTPPTRLYSSPRFAGTRIDQVREALLVGCTTDRSFRISASNSLSLSLCAFFLLVGPSSLPPGELWAP